MPNLVILNKYGYPFNILTKAKGIGHLKNLNSDGNETIYEYSIRIYNLLEAGKPIDWIPDFYIPEVVYKKFAMNVLNEIEPIKQRKTFANLTLSVDLVFIIFSQIQTQIDLMKTSNIGISKKIKVNNPEKYGKPLNKLPIKNKYKAFSVKELVKQIYLFINE